ncbi:MAG: DNA-3-methyladenine glycosylase 2 family protein [Chloroflexi bacterium]|nr:DNA-3-methyladenine glycosylase 2 family protein [Chloroflexota bacterium]
MQPTSTHLYTEQGYLTAVPPFDFSKSLDFLGHFAPMKTEQVIAASNLTKAVYVEGQLVAFQLTSTGTVEEPKLAYTLYSECSIDEAIKHTALDRISFFLSLDEDLHPFYQMACADAAFVPIMQDLYGYHQVKFLTPFENACWAVVAQRNTQPVARRMKRALTETYGGSIQVQGVTYWAFPEAARLAHLSEDELVAVVRNARKAEYLLAVIRAFNEVDEHFLRTGDYEEVAAWLQHIRGFGEWSVGFVMLRGLGRMERVPLTEKHLLEAASRVYGHGKELSRREIVKIAEWYGVYQGYWAHYLRVGS